MSTELPEEIREAVKALASDFFIRCRSLDDANSYFTTTDQARSLEDLIAAHLELARVEGARDAYRRVWDAATDASGGLAEAGDAGIASTVIGFKEAEARVAAAQAKVEEVRGMNQGVGN